MINMAQGDSCVLQYVDIIKSYNDHRSYKGLELINKMKVLLISDPTISKASAIMTVNIGYFSDSDDLPGLTNLCLRTLTLGTQKYPSYKEFQNFISKHDGTYIGYVSAEYSTYYFDINVNHFEDALQRYVHFFLTPLFKKDWIEQDVKVINTQYKQAFEDDDFRLEMFAKSLVKSDHPYSKCFFGNEESLKTISEKKRFDIKRRVLEYYEKYYSANLMSLCIVSNVNLNKLEKMVVDNFCNVRNKEVIVPMWYPHPFNHMFCTKWYIVPKKNIRFLKIVFPLPEIRLDHWYMAMNIISCLLENEKEGSLLSILKNKDWCITINAIAYEYATGVNTFELTIMLTKNGLSHVDDIIMTLFQYIDIIQSKSNQLIIASRSILDEKMKDDLICNTQMKTSFNIKNMIEIAQGLHEYSMDRVLFKKNICPNNECNVDIIHWILYKYLLPQKIRIYVIAKGCENIAQETNPNCGGIKFKEEKISEEIINTWKRPPPHSGLNLSIDDNFIVEFGRKLHSKLYHPV